MHALYLRSHERERTRAATVIEEWRIAQDKLTGTFRVFKLGRDERDVQTLGPFASEGGVHSGQRWQQTRNGLTFTYPGVHEAADAISDRAWQLADDPHDARLIGESVPYSAYVVELNPPGGRHEWIFIDKKSGNIVRREALAKNRRVTTIYDEFRTFDGIPEPSRVRTLDSYGNDREQTLLSRTLDLTPDPHDVDVTPSRRTLVEFPAGIPLVHLPVRIVNGLVVVRVRIGIRPYDFLLDSGAAGIVVDPSVIDDLHLETYGARVGATIGSFNETSAILPLLGVGPLRLRNAVVRVVGVPFHLDDRTKVAGLLGFDFFLDAVVHIDLEHAVVDALAPGTFRPTPDLTAVGVALDDRTPAARAHAVGTYGRMIVDTGSNRTILTPAFAARTDANADPNAVTRVRSVGGTATAEAIHLRSFDLGGVSIADPVLDVSTADLGFEGIDGTVGTDVLRAYDLFFDFRTSQLYLRRTRKTG